MRKIQNKEICKKVAHFGEIVIKMYRTEMMNADYLSSRQNDPTIHQKRKNCIRNGNTTI
jgi:hypothetical protein